MVAPVAEHAQALTVFVAGTDTDVGKTWFCQRLIAALALDYDAVGYKPIAAGTESIGDQQLNIDAFALQQASTRQHPYTSVNPILFHEPIAPHIAAQQTGQPIDVGVLSAGLEKLCASTEVVVVEGAGGWLTPLSADRTFADWVHELKMPVILVVDVRVGCLNHAQLSAKVIQETNQLIGWVANVRSSEMQYVAENINHLNHVLQVPLLAHCTDNGLAEPESWSSVSTRIVDHLRENC